MSLSIAIALVSMLSPQGTPAVAEKPQTTTLSRVFKQGEKLSYSFKSSLQSDERNHELDSFLPNNQGYEYSFTINVLKLLADGICELQYRRPGMTIVYGENAFRDEVRKEYKSNTNMKLKVSPINEVLDSEDLNPPKKEDPKAKKKAEEPEPQEQGVSQVSLVDPLPYTNEIYRLAAFVGNLDSSLDFAPSMPFDEVKPGDTWKKTVGFAPQNLKGAKGKQMAMQRLDMVYKYDGVKEVNGKKVVRISSSLSMDSDITLFLAQQFFADPENSPFRKVKLRLKSTVEYDLDPKTLTTLEARGKSEGDYSMELKEIPGQAFQEAKIKGNALLKLVSRS